MNPTIEQVQKRLPQRFCSAICRVVVVGFEIGTGGDYRARKRGVYFGVDDLVEIVM